MCSDRMGIHNIRRKYMDFLSQDQIFAVYFPFLIITIVLRTGRAQKNNPQKRK